MSPRGSTNLTGFFSPRLSATCARLHPQNLALYRRPNPHVPSFRVHDTFSVGKLGRLQRSHKACSHCARLRRAPPQLFLPSSRSVSTLAVHIIVSMAGWRKRKRRKRLPFSLLSEHCIRSPSISNNLLSFSASPELSLQPRAFDSFAAGPKSISLPARFVGPMAAHDLRQHCYATGRCGRTPRLAPRPALFQTQITVSHSWPLRLKTASERSQFPAQHWSSREKPQTIIPTRESNPLDSPAACIRPRFIPPRVVCRPDDRPNSLSGTVFEIGIVQLPPSFHPVRLDISLRDAVNPLIHLRPCRYRRLLPLLCALRISISRASALPSASSQDPATLPLFPSPSRAQLIIFWDSSRLLHLHVFQSVHVKSASARIIASPS